MAVPQAYIIDFVIAAPHIDMLHCLIPYQDTHQHNKDIKDVAEFIAMRYY